MNEEDWVSKCAERLLASGSVKESTMAVRVARAICGEHMSEYPENPELAADEDIKQWW